MSHSLRPMNHHVILQERPKMFFQSPVCWDSSWKIPHIKISKTVHDRLKTKKCKHRYGLVNCQAHKFLRSMNPKRQWNPLD